MAKYIYTHLIPENVAPSGATKIGVYDADENRVHQISLGALTPPAGEKIYSFGLISDTHLMANNDSKFENALNWFKDKVDFICHCGDITNHGFYYDPTTGKIDEEQFNAYDTIRKSCGVTIHRAFGNHDCYQYTDPATQITKGRPLTNDLEKLAEYTGSADLHYRVDHKGDVFLFAGQTYAYEAMSDHTYAWLTEQIADLNGKRCFIFTHGFFSKDSGDTTNGAYGSSLLDGRKELKTILAKTQNVVLFHGHSHFRFNQQEVEESIIYTNKNGFHSVHVPSLSAPAFVNASGKREQTNESYGYLVDVYADCIILRGRNFGTVSGSAMVNPAWDAHGTYKINVAQPNG